MNAAPAGAIPKLVITSRSLSDYRDMFLLTDEELLAGPVLDCPAGASPFGAQVRARGGRVVSVDPAYHSHRTELAARIGADLANVRGWLGANRENFDWSYLGSPHALLRAFEVAADYFLDDYRPDNGNYVAASLPSLPLPDRHFRLTVSSHLLFTYPDSLTFDEHVASLLELVRVTSGEVRVCPVTTSAGTVYPRLDDVRRALSERGVHTEIRRAASAFAKAGDSLLACRRVA